VARSLARTLRSEHPRGGRHVRSSARQQLHPRKSEEAQGLHRSYQVLYEQLVKVFKQLGGNSMRVEGKCLIPLRTRRCCASPVTLPRNFIVEELQAWYQLERGRVLRQLW